MPIVLLEASVSRHQRVSAALRTQKYIATAEAYDAEMRDRIARHQAERDSLWQT
jgi:adenosylcobinamide kinase/adenosylcobinamide-phosphate guanylyltransferase